VSRPSGVKSRVPSAKITRITFDDLKTRHASAIRHKSRDSRFAIEMPNYTELQLLTVVVSALVNLARITCHAQWISPKVQRHEGLGYWSGLFPTVFTGRILRTTADYCFLDIPFEVYNCFLKLPNCYTEQMIVKQRSKTSATDCDACMFM
jgi:hypothetical protein